MATRIRCVKPEFYRHLGLYRLEQQTGLPIRISFEGLWTVADRDGRFRWRPHDIKLDVLPYDEVDFAVILDELARERFIVSYVIDGERYGYIPTWTKHQRPNHREKPSDLPIPPAVADESPVQLELNPPTRGQVRAPCLGGTGTGTGRGTGRGRGSNSPTPLEILPAPAAEKSKPGGDQTPFPLTNENDNDNDNDNIVPLDLTEVEYARKLLDDLGSPSKGNIVIVADSIRAFAKSKALPLPAAFEQMHAIAFEARARGEPVDHLWFLNTRYINPKPRSKSDVASDQFHDRFREEFAILERQQSRAKSA
jgi:hypothetical protein